MPPAPYYVGLFFGQLHFAPKAGAGCRCPLVRGEQRLGPQHEVQETHRDRAGGPPRLAEMRTTRTGCAVNSAGLQFAEMVATRVSRPERDLAPCAIRS